MKKDGSSESFQEPCPPPPHAPGTTAEPLAADTNVPDEVEGDDEAYDLYFEFSSVESHDCSEEFEGETDAVDTSEDEAAEKSWDEGNPPGEDDAVLHLLGVPGLPNPLPSVGSGSVDEAVLGTPPLTTDMTAVSSKGIFKPSHRYTFSKTLSTEIGVDGAILLYWLKLVMKKSTRTSEAGKLVRVGSVELSKRYPWKNRRAWSKTLKKLSDDGLLSKSYKHRISGLDKTFSFAVHDNLLSRADQEPIHFLAGDAAEYGVCAAVLLNNLRFFLRQNIMEHGQQRRHAMKPSEIVGRLPFFSLSSVKRALDALCKAEQVKREWNPKILASEYWIPGYAPDITAGVDPHPVAVNPPVETIAPSEIQFAADSPEVKSGVFERLVESNRLQLASEPRELIVAIAVVAAEEASSLIETISGRDLLKVAQYRDDQLVAVLQARAQSRGDFPPSGIVLETAVLALRYDAVRARSSHELVFQHAYKLSLKVIARRNEELTKRNQEKIAGWKVRVEEVLQPLAAKLDANDLAPAAKRSILRDALAVRARLQMMREPPYPSAAPTLVPYPCWGSNGAYKAAEIFFKANPSWSARLLFDILERCAQLGEYTGDGYDPQYYARRGVDLAFMLCNFDNVVKQLEIESSLPEFVLVDVDELFPKNDKRESDPSTSPNT